MTGKQVQTNVPKGALFNDDDKIDWINANGHRLDPLEHERWVGKEGASDSLDVHVQTKAPPHIRSALVGPY